MFKLLFKTTAYYVIWQKFRKQIILILLSILGIAIINILYNDLFEVLKVNSKDSIGFLLFIKWFLIFIIIVFNIYKFKKIKIKDKGKEEEIIIIEEVEEHDINKHLVKKKKLKTRTDLILRKYSND